MKLKIANVQSIIGKLFFFTFIDRYRTMDHENQIKSDELDAMASNEKLDKIREMAWNYKDEGLNTLEYEIVSFEEKHLYTNISISL